MEIEKLESMKEEFLVDHSEQDFADLINGWDDKVERVKSKTQTVSNFICIKVAVYLIFFSGRYLSAKNKEEVQ